MPRYLKKEAIQYAHEFITKEMGLTISYVTVFAGSHGVPKDNESKEIWNSLGITDVREEGMENVFWGPTGSGGPCGPTTEIYCKNANWKDIEISLDPNSPFPVVLRNGSLEKAKELQLVHWKISLIQENSLALAFVTAHS